MSYKQYLFFLFCALPFSGFAQNGPHYTMFMYNKLVYNPAYAGSREVMSVNGTYRDQWSGIDGAPKTYSISVDGPIGTYKGVVRKVALGLSFTNEQIGVEKSNNIMAVYAYRIKLKNSVLSFGLQGGAKLYSASYDKLVLQQPNDPNFTANINNAFLPNFGAGIYLSGDKYYVGASVPNLVENYYDKNQQFSNSRSRQVQSYYATAGYTIRFSDAFSLQPQAIARYTGNATYKLPLSCDLNLSAIFYSRLLLGATYRTDGSYEGIVHLQVTKDLNIGYAYDYLTSPLSSYYNGSHEFAIGIDFIREHSKYTTPRFIKTF
jgi:type IX secretion system PorP/SprF family membrane protein